MRCRAVVASLVVASALATAARAAVLELRSGELVPGKVESLDDEGVTFVPDGGGSLRVAWDRVVPRNRYELWRASLAPSDAAGRVRLAKWCVAAGLFRPALRELLEAKGLGYAGEDDLDALAARARAAEADDVLERVDALVERGDLDAALERLTAYLRVADPGPDADRARTRVPDLVRSIERRDEEARQAEEDRRKAEKDGRLKDWVDRTLKAADGKREEAAAAAAEGFTWLAKGNQTRARAALGKAEGRYQSARADYVRVKKALKTGEVADLCAERIEDCDDRTVEVLTRWGALEVDNKAWKAASPVVDRGLKIDPVDRELLELRATIDANWIRRRMSGLTNAHGTSSGN